jgi:hypothetical protein
LEVVELLLEVVGGGKGLLEGCWRLFKMVGGSWRVVGGLLLVVVGWMVVVGGY